MLRNLSDADTQCAFDIPKFDPSDVLPENKSPNVPLPRQPPQLLSFPRSSCLLHQVRPNRIAPIAYVVLAQEAPGM